MQVICRFARTCACIKGRRWPGSDRTCKYKLFAISTRFIWLDLSKILPFFTFINRPVYNFVSETSLPRETNRTRSIMDFFSIGNIDGIQGQADCSSKSIHPTNFTSFTSTKRPHTSQRNSVNVERSSITIKRNSFHFAIKQRCSRSRESLVFHRNKNINFLLPVACRGARSS